MDFSIETSKGPVSAQLHIASKSAPLLALAHGAGGDMNSPFHAAFAEALPSYKVSCLKFNFPFSEKKRRSPDTAKVLSETWRSVWEEAKRRASSVWVGGKSMGGRYASMMVADGAEVDGLIFLSYPLHAVGKQEKLRSDHWGRIKVPALFIEGTSDPMARWELLVKELKKFRSAELYTVDGAGHSFEPRDAEKLAKVAADFIRSRS